MANQKIYNVKLRRIDICDLLLACTAASDASGADKWSALHDKLMEQLNRLDEANGIPTK